MSNIILLNARNTLKKVINQITLCSLCTIDTLKLNKQVFNFTSILFKCKHFIIAWSSILIRKNIGMVYCTSNLLQLSLNLSQICYNDNIKTREYVWKLYFSNIKPHLDCKCHVYWSLMPNNHWSCLYLLILYIELIYIMQYISIFKQFLLFYCVI